MRVIVVYDNLTPFRRRLTFGWRTGALGAREGAATDPAAVEPWPHRTRTHLRHTTYIFRGALYVPVLRLNMIDSAVLRASDRFVSCPNPHFFVFGLAIQVHVTERLQFNESTQCPSSGFHPESNWRL